MAETTRPGVWWGDPADGIRRRVVAFRDYRRDVIEPGRDPNRILTLETALDLNYFSGPVKFIGVPTTTVGDLRDLFGWIIEPAFRMNCDLVIECDTSPRLLQRDNYPDPEFRFPFTLERIQWVDARFGRLEPHGPTPPLTPIEAILHDACSRAEIAVRPQYGVGRFRADFAIPEKRLLIEADGRFWHDAARDAARDEILRRSGWQVLRFTGSEITQDPDGCAAVVRHAVALRTNAITYSDLADEAQIAKRPWWQRFIDWLLRRSGSSVEDPEPRVVVADHGNRLDEEQRRAVAAHDGVVQVIAPAGSGKTTVMVERVVELVARGVPETRILCTTFNAATRVELRERLAQRGITSSAVHTFHSVGRHILDRQGLLRKDIGTVSHGQWRRLANLAKNDIPNGVWVDAPDAVDLVSNFKLGLMITPGEARSRAKTVAELTAAKLYEFYEQELTRTDRNDFDDLILRSLRALQDDEGTRQIWQDRWWCVLVDEYQDIEPAQELLVRCLAAPHDSLFVVGDEDQCIYAWRRASVERIVELDQHYPGLERHVLANNYRSPEVIVQTAKNLIEHNRRRYPKPMLAKANRIEPSFNIVPAADDAAQDAAVTDLLSNADASETVVLGRTSVRLREVALSCLDRGIPISASDRILRPSFAEQVIRSYLAVCHAPAVASVDDVKNMFRVPNRYLPDDAVGGLLENRRSGKTFTSEFDALRTDSWRLDRLRKDAELLDALTTLGPLGFMRKLRADGGLDRHFSDQEKMNPHDLVEIDALDSIERMAANTKTCEALLDMLDQRSARLADANSDDGIEISTIHGSKGREWLNVIVVGFEEKLLPHSRSLSEAEGEAAREAEVLEDERRLAYVALTRSKAKLTIFHNSESPSRFLAEMDRAPTSPPAPIKKSTPAADQRTKPVGEPTRRPASPNARPTTSQTGGPSPTVSAKFATKCPHCGRGINVGDQIVRTPASRWKHQHC